MSPESLAGFDPSVLVRGEHYARAGYPHGAWTRLRRESPVHRCEVEGFEPFWAIVKYAGLVEISRRPSLFRSAPRLVLSPDSVRFAPPEQTGRSLLKLDPPEHGRDRALTRGRLAPRAACPMTS